MSIVFNRARPRDSRLDPLRMWRILGSTIFTSFFFCERFVFMHPHFGASKARVCRCKAARARVCTYLCRQRDWFEWDRTAPFKRGQRVRAARPCYRGGPCERTAITDWNIAVVQEPHCLAGRLWDSPVRPINLEGSKVVRIADAIFRRGSELRTLFLLPASVRAYNAKYGGNAGVRRLFAHAPRFFQ